jgi:hypothetical protein
MSSVTIRPSTKAAHGGYRVTFSPGDGSRGFATEAADMKTVHLALDHYYRPEVGVESPHRDAASGLIRTVAECPLCRDIAARAAKLKR